MFVGRTCFEGSHIFGSNLLFFFGGGVTVFSPPFDKILEQIFWEFLCSEVIIMGG